MLFGANPAWSVNQLQPATTVVELVDAEKPSATAIKLYGPPHTPTALRQLKAAMSRNKLIGVYSQRLSAHHVIVAIKPLQAQVAELISA